MIARARQAGIPDSNIFATGSDEAKVAKIQELGIKKHLDNKKSVIDRLGFKGQLFENGGEVPYNYNPFVSAEPEVLEQPQQFTSIRTENDPEDYDQFLNYSRTAPENRRPTEGYTYGNPNDYDHYGMWDALGKPTDFNQALEMNPDWTPDEYDGMYHGFSVNPNTGVFLKAGKPGGMKEGDTTWMEIAGHYLSPRAQVDTPVFDTDLQRFKYIPNKQDGGNFNGYTNLFKFENGGDPPYNNLPPTYISALKNFVYPNVVANPARTGHNALTNTISYDPESPIENVNNAWWMEHELFHELQNQAGGLSTSGIMGQRPNQYTASDQAIQSYYNRRESDINRIVDQMIEKNPELQFIPRELLIKGGPGFVGAEQLQYSDPRSLEGEARLYEQYIRKNNPSIFPQEAPRLPIRPVEEIPIDQSFKELKPRTLEYGGEYKQYGGYSGLFNYANGGTEGEPIENPPIYTWEGDPNSYYRKDEKGNWRYLNKDTQSEFASGLYAFDKVRNRKVKKKLDAEAVLNPNAEAVLNQWGNTLTTPEISEVTLDRKETRKERKEREARYQAMTPEERRIFDQRKEQMKEEMWRRDNPNLLANNFFNDPSNMTSEQLRQMAYKAPFAEAQKWLDMAEVQARREGELRTNKREKDYFEMGMGTMHGGDYLAPGETYASTYNKLNNFKTSEELPYAYAGTDKSGNIQLMTQEQKAKNDAQLAQITAVNEALKNRALIEQIEGRKLTDKDIYGEDGNYSPNLAKYSTQSYLQKIDDQKYQNFLAENQKAADEAGILYNSMDFLRNLAVNFPSTTINLLEGKMPLFQQGLGLRSEDPELRAMYEGYMPAGGTDTDYWFNFINPVASLQDAKISYDLGNYGDAALAGLGALPLIGAVGKGTAKGVGILDDAYRAAMSKSDEFARSFNLVDEAPVTSSTFTQSTDDLANLTDEATTSIGARNNPTNFYDEYLYNENVNLERIPEEDLMTAFSENPNAIMVEAISPILPGGYTNLDEFLLAQNKAFNEGVDISKKWVLSDSEKYYSTIDEASKIREEIPKIRDQKSAIIDQRDLVVQKAIEDFMQSKGLLEKYKENPFRTDIPQSFFIEFNDDLMKNPDYIKLTDEINSYDEAIKKIEVNANQKILDAEQYVDPIFKEKVQNLYNLAGQNIPEVANIRKDTPILLSLLESDPLLSTLSKKAQDYIRTNSDNIGGVALTTGETITVGSEAGNEYFFLSTPKNPMDKSEIIKTVEQRFYPIERVRGVAAHEGGHSIGQSAYDWRYLIQKDDPMYGYYTNHSDNDIAKEFKTWMAEPTLPNEGTPATYNDDGTVKYTTETWRSGVGELHSELMLARSEVVSDYVNRYGMPIDEAIELVKKKEAEGDPFLFEYYLKDSPADLSKHFKKDTPDQIKKQLIQALPAVLIIAGAASGISMAGSGDGSTTNTQGYKLGGSHKNKYIGLFRQ
jgi:hypothetical protein